MSSLDSQVLSRKERLAQLRNLKRKREEERQEDAGSTGNRVEEDQQQGDVQDRVTSREGSEDARHDEQVIASILPRRNYDPDTQAPRQGYFEPPTASSVPTVEEEAARIEKAAAVEDEELQEEQGIEDEADLDSSELQPRPVNWDFKRQLTEKLEILRRQTDVALNRIVRERLNGLKGTNALPAGVDLNRAMEETEKNSI
ncbi:mRNA splicing factor [Lipomyces chichibuensis]|uniref:mRNA splicing factor n=1 Tax=Lipomyces chichibuensis TaxID=1546026 RepID=UPI003342FD82